MSLLTFLIEYAECPAESRSGNVELHGSGDKHTNITMQDYHDKTPD